MKTECCAEISDAKRIEEKSGLTDPARQHRYGEFVIPAGILIGLGVGLLADRLFSGFLAGLGLGLVVSELLVPGQKSSEGDYRQQAGVNMMVLLFGAFLVLVGIGIDWVPAAAWLYAIAGFLILAGIAILIRGFSRFS